MPRHYDGEHGDAAVASRRRGSAGKNKQSQGEEYASNRHGSHSNRVR